MEYAATTNILQEPAVPNAGLDLWNLAINQIDTIATHLELTVQCESIDVIVIGALRVWGDRLPWSGTLLRVTLAVD